MVNPREIQPEREPSADIRQLASNLRQVYLALIREGFSPYEALAIIGHAVQGASRQTP